jgi:hypothetical protein
MTVLLPPPVANAAAPPTYEKIVPTNWRYLKNIVLAIFTGSLYLFYQSHQLQKALQCGKIEAAKEAMSKGGWWVYQHTIRSDDFRSLAFTKETESIKLIAAQILFDSKLTSGGSSAANALIEARDIGVDHYNELKILEKILPLTTVNKTAVDMNRAAILREAERIFVKDIGEPEPDDLSHQYLEKILDDCRTIEENDRLQTFIKMACGSFPDYKNNPESRSFLTEFYDARFSPIKFASSILHHCRTEPDCTVDTFINAIYAKFPSLKTNDSKKFYSRESLTAFYNKKIE